MKSTNISAAVAMAQISMASEAATPSGWTAIESAPATTIWAEAWRSEKLLARQACFRQVSTKLPMPKPDEMMTIDWWSDLGTNVLPVRFSPTSLVVEKWDWSAMGEFPQSLVLELVAKYGVPLVNQAGEAIVV